MNKEALLDELNRLLDAGEPLLTLFPKQHPDDWWLRLPVNISYEMRLYARDVACRAWDRKALGGFLQRETTVYLAERVEDLEVGLVGWRAIGVLK